MMNNQGFKDYFNNSDEEIVIRAQNGDSKAKEYILNKYKGLVVSEARDFFIQGCAFEDVLQEGNIGLINAIEHFSLERKSAFSAFAKVCIRNKIINVVNNSNNEGNSALNQSISVDFTDENSEMKADLEKHGPKVEDPEDLFILKEEKILLKKLLVENLTDFEMEVISLLLEGYSYEKIGEKLGKDAKSVDNARSRVKKKLKKVLETK